MGSGVFGRTGRDVNRENKMKINEKKTGRKVNAALIM